MNGLLMAAVVAITVAVFVFAETGFVMAATKPEMPLQGLYDYCDLSSPECLDRLDKMSEAGFEIVLVYASGSSGKDIEEMLAYLDRAEQNKMKVIWDFNELVGRDDASEVAIRVVQTIKDHPALWGYCVGDENDASQAEEVRRLSDAIFFADSDHPRIFVGNYDSQNLVPFIDCAEVLGLDVYPIGSSEDSLKMVGEVGLVAEDLRRFNEKNSKRSAMVLQAFNWEDDRDAPDWQYKRWPTRVEMRRMRDQAIRNSDPEIILWFSYYYAAQDEEHWNNLAWAAFGDQCLEK